MLSVERGRKRTVLGMAASNNSRCDGNELCLGMVSTGLLLCLQKHFPHPYKGCWDAAEDHLPVLASPHCVHTWQVLEVPARLDYSIWAFWRHVQVLSLCLILHLVIHWFNSPESFLSFFQYHSPPGLGDNLNLSVYSKRMEIRDLLSPSFFLTQWLWLSPYKPTYSQTLWSPLSCMALLC